MFKKKYQGGSSVDVFSAQGQDPVQHWRLTGSVKKDFDKSVRSYVYVLDGGVSTTTTHMTLPKSDKTSLCLVQPCCVLQLLVPDSAKLVVDLSVLDSTGNRRRLHLSTSQREVSATPLNARLPLPGMLTGEWLNLCIDLGSLVQSLFKGSSFKSLEGLSLGGSCRLKRVFTLLTTPTCSDTVAIPAFHMNSVLLQTIIISPQNLMGVESRTKRGRQGGDDGSGKMYSRFPAKATHVAFGKKVAIPDHILEKKVATPDPTLRKEVAITDHVLASRQASCDVGIKVVKEELIHEPSPAVSQSLLKVQRVGVSMVSARSSKRSGATSPVQVSQDVRSVVFPRQRRGRVETTIVTSPPPPVRTMAQQQQGESRGHSLTSNEELDGIPSNRKELRGPTNRKELRGPTNRKELRGPTNRKELRGPTNRKELRGATNRKELRGPTNRKELRGPTNRKELRGAAFMCDEKDDACGDEQVLTSDVELALTVLQHRLTGQKELVSGYVDVESGHEELVSGLSLSKNKDIVSGHAEVESGHEEAESGHEEAVSGLSLSRHKEVVSGHKDVVSGGEELVLEGGMDLSVGDDDDEEIRQQVYSYSSKPKSAERRDPALMMDEGSSSRGAKLEEDFLSPTNSSPPSSFSHTRLSDDYDWRQYVSADDQGISDDVSLRTRLAAGAHPHHAHTHTASTCLDDTLTESITLSSETEQFKNARPSPFLDAMDTSGMGGMLSPTPLEELVSHKAAEDQLDHGGGGGEVELDELELMYDPQLNCFYDPITCKYYELIQPN